MPLALTSNKDDDHNDDTPWPRRKKNRLHQTCRARTAVTVAHFLYQRECWGGSHNRPRQWHRRGCRRRRRIRLSPHHGDATATTTTTAAAAAASMDNTDDKEDECQKQEETTTLKPKEEEEQQKEVDVENTFFVFQPRTVPDILSSMIAWYVLECCSVAKDAAFARLLLACLLGCLLVMLLLLLIVVIIILLLLIALFTIIIVIIVITIIIIGIRPIVVRVDGTPVEGCTHSGWCAGTYHQGHVLQSASIPMVGTTQTRTHAHICKYARTSECTHRGRPEPKRESNRTKVW